MYEDYQRRGTEDPFSETWRSLLDEISESTDFTHISHILPNGKGNKDYIPQREREKTTRYNTESMLTSPFQMEALVKGIKTECLDDMLCEQIKNLGLVTLRWAPQMMNSILKSHKFPMLWRKASDSHP